ncbi:hypothetical protein JOF56_005502 [Kibdelosporangium banguiense]|uniref:Uncharacterized protein n=1 Tax=Kibdelosporangium banguiense TaxID=1365924 RepID=A0ABS4TL15_9PSEU|nr:hypothetical protein [Kibdelosporangium banguiense]MBP2325117.1 hypothetical protein [Kibdelosporangium banguiense]
MTTLIVLTVVEIVLLIAGLAVFLFWIGSLLTRIASNLSECAERVATVRGHASDIVPGVEHINRTGRVVASALPLLYGFAEQIVPSPPSGPRPVTGRRRSRLHETVGYTPR